MTNEAKDTRTISRLYDVKVSDKIIGKRKIEDGFSRWNLFFGKFAWDWMFWSLVMRFHVDAKGNALCFYELKIHDSCMGILFMN